MEKDQYSENRPPPWGSSSRQAFTYLLRSWTIWSFADNGFMVLHRVCLRLLPQLEEQESSGCAAGSVHESGSMTHRFAVNVSKTIMTLLPTAIKLTSHPIGGFFVFFCLLSSHTDSWDVHKLKNPECGCISRSPSKEDIWLFVPFPPIVSFMLRWSAVRLDINLKLKSIRSLLNKN